MRLKQNYKFQMYEDCVKVQAPSAGQSAEAALQAHLPLPGQHSHGNTDAFLNCSREIDKDINNLPWARSETCRAHCPQCQGVSVLSHKAYM